MRGGTDERQKTVDGVVSALVARDRNMGNKTIFSYQGRQACHELRGCADPMYVYNDVQYCIVLGSVSGSGPI